MSHRTPGTIALVAALLAGCGGSGETQPDHDGGLPDSGLSDSGPMDDGGAPDASPDDAGPMTDGGTVSNDISIIVEPSDKAAALVSAISGAKTSVHMTMYLLSSYKVINALIAQHQAGHEVKVLLNKTFPPNSGSNNSVFSQLQTAGVSVAWAPATFTYTHEKCVIIDGSTAWIMTMNATDSSATGNREFLAVDTDPEDVQEAETIFEKDFAGTPPTSVSGKLVVAPTPLNARTRMLQVLNSAKTSIDLEGEELSDTYIVNALASSHSSGIAVRVVLSDGTLTTAQQTAVTKLKAAGVPVVSVSSPYIHAKAFVVDGSTAYVGSANFTAESLDHNRELGIITTATSEVTKIANTIAGDFAKGTAL
jgi:phosphatidylserine/phosphatidylglycerophosphate/cardiolipin synthase-like enzyme